MVKVCVQNTPHQSGFLIILQCTEKNMSADLLRSFILRNSSRVFFLFLFFQVLSDYLVKKLETEPSIYPRCSVCSCRRSQLPYAALGVTPGLTWGDHPYRGEGEPAPLLLPPGAEIGVLQDDRVSVRDKAEATT